MMIKVHLDAQVMKDIIKLLAILTASNSILIGLSKFGKLQVECLKFTSEYAHLVCTRSEHFMNFRVCHSVMSK